MEVPYSAGLLVFHGIHVELPVQNFVHNSADFRNFSWDHVLGGVCLYCAKVRCFVLEYTQYCVEMRKIC